MNIFVGCSSREEIPKNFLELASEVGKLIQHENVIIGGTKVGMMGRVVEHVSFQHITQIILKDYVKEEMIFQNDYQICDTSFERLNRIWNSADVFLFLPGGTGTFGELLTFLEENRMKKEKKKIILFNEQHYFDDVITFIEKMKQQNFVNDDILEGLVIVSNILELRSCLKGIKL